MLQTFIKQLIIELTKPLPGPEAQQLMMPKESTKARFDLNRNDARRGGVMLLFYEKSGTIYLPLTQRHDYGGTHGGQVSLPGGKIEPHDMTIEDTALRETHEEIGIYPRDITVIGRLTDLYIPPSNFRVTPVIGYTDKEPIFNINSYEVKELIETPLNTLIKKANIKQKNITVRQGMRLNAPYFDVKGKVVWGATAMILSEFCELISDTSKFNK